MKVPERGDAGGGGPRGLPLPPYTPEAASVDPATDFSPVALPSSPPLPTEPAACARLPTSGPAVAACPPGVDAPLALAQALADVDADPPRARGETRAGDVALARMEGCAAFAKGFVRALRAEAAPECAEALARPLLTAPDVGGGTRATLAGLALASRISRWRPRVSTFHGAPSVEAVRTFAAATLDADLRRLEAELAALESQTLTLPEKSYGRARALVAVSDAWLRAGSTYDARERADAPMRDPELRSTWFEALTKPARDRLDPEGRSRHSTALAAMADQGVLQDAAVIGWLSRLDPVWDDRLGYWDRLALPTTPSAATTNADDALVERLGPWFVDRWVPAQRSTAPEVWGALARGLPPELRARLTAWLASDAARASTEAPGLHLSLARLLVRVGILYRQRAPLERAAIEAAYATPGSEAAFLRALAMTVLLAPDHAPWLAIDGSRALDLSALDAFLRAEPAGPLELIARYDRGLLALAAAPAADKTSLLGDLSRLAERAGDAPYAACMSELATACGPDALPIPNRGVDGGAADCACRPWAWRPRRAGP